MMVNIIWLMMVNDGNIWRFPFRHGGTPSSHPFDWDASNSSGEISISPPEAMLLSGALTSDGTIKKIRSSHKHGD